MGSLTKVLTWSLLLSILVTFVLCVRNNERTTRQIFDELIESCYLTKSLNNLSNSDKIRLYELVEDADGKINEKIVCPKIEGLINLASRLKLVKPPKGYRDNRRIGHRVLR